MQNPFSSITTAGLLLPLDLITRVSSMDRSLPGMTPADYHVAGSIRLNEAATAAYSRALAYWKSFRKKFDALPASDTGTTLTRDEWLLPLFDCLGYGRLQIKRSISIDSKDYPISHGWEDHVPIHLLSARLPLDKRTQNVSGAATRSPYSLVQELLNRSSNHRWGFVSNGLRLYVLRDNASLTRSANVEFDLETMMDGEYHADFTALFLTCHQSRLEIQPTPIVDSKGPAKKASKLAKTTKNKPKSEDDETVQNLLLELNGDEEVNEIEEPTRLGPENCWLEAWTKLAGEQGTRAKERLRDGVQLAIQKFGEGFYTSASNAELHQRLRSGELPTQDYYRQLLRLVYRLLMLMVAEDKRTESGQNLFHPIDTPAHIRDRYNRFYSVGRIRKLANERRGTPHRDLYESLKTTFLKLRDGYAPLGIPGIGSFLFSATATPDLDTAQITNEALLEAFRHLCFTEDATGRGGGVRRVVDFGNLGSEELGSIYESLLELQPEIDGAKGPFILDEVIGSERKRSGSYYTPTSLINSLLDSALDPVVHRAIDVPDREEAKRRLLNLKVCDPACGSGHFLIAAANRMALHLARLETQDTEPTTLQIQHAKRQIIGRCIYGVDINEMAVELCKVSLWMEALEPGKPFSFLENHIKCGNSLIGATPRLLDEGIPDEAFNPMDGDNKAVCSQLKKDNKRERSEYKSGQGYLFEPFYKLGNMADRFAKLSVATDESLDAIEDKQKQYEELIKGMPYLNARFWADTWCAAFVWRKDDTDLGRLCPTERKYREIERNPHSASTLIRDEINQLAKSFQFFHWHLAFPEVFALPDKGNIADSPAGWNNGFNLILGNPPWEMPEVDDRQFFATREKSITNETSARNRQVLIHSLSTSQPAVFEAWKKHVRIREAERTFLASSNRFPYGGSGRLNYYKAFLEAGWNAVDEAGCLGMVIPSGLTTNAYERPLWHHLLKTRSLTSIFDFENRKLLFPNVDGRAKFSLITLGRNSSSFLTGCWLLSPDSLSENDRIIELSANRLAELSPEELTLPQFRSSADLRLLETAVARFGRFADHKSWSYTPRLMFSSSDEAFRTEAIEAVDNGTRTGTNRVLTTDGRCLVPVYEGKMVGILDHRQADIYLNLSNPSRKAQERAIPTSQKQDVMRFAVPQHWIDIDAVRMRRFSKMQGEWELVFCDVTSATNERTSLAAIVPLSGLTRSLPAIYLKSACAKEAASLACIMSSLIYDYFARLRVSSNHMTQGILAAMPVPSLEAVYDFEHSVLDKPGWFAKAGFEMSYSANDLRPFADDFGFNGPPFPWDEEKRRYRQAEIHAASLLLYGIDRTDAVYILSTFPTLRRREIMRFGEYLTERLVLEKYDELTMSRMEK